MEVGDIVRVTSLTSRRYRNNIGKIILECKTKWSDRMFLVEFLEGKAKFYESSLKFETIDEEVLYYGNYI